MKFRKKPVVIDATQWFKNGDHPLDECTHVLRGKGDDGSDIAVPEGKVVRYFRRPDISGDLLCKHCTQRMCTHGWIDTLEGGHIVCPGDYVITGVKGERYPCKPDIFDATYEAVDA